jgi:hypothetical protein
MQPLLLTLAKPPTEGPNTHTRATAGGAAVRGASAFGYGAGTAWGRFPCAHVAAYLVCFDADVFVGFEATIREGVHVISTSVDSDAYEYFDDDIAISCKSSRRSCRLPTQPPVARRNV